MYSIKSSDGQDHSIEIQDGSISINGDLLSWDISPISGHRYNVISGGIPYEVELVKANWKEKSITIKVEDQLFDLEVKDRMDKLLEKMGISAMNTQSMAEVKAPMPGLILDILVEEGQTVNKGDQLMILEAMKMENILKSPGEGVIKSIEVSKGDSVEKNQVLIKF